MALDCFELPFPGSDRSLHVPIGLGLARGGRDGDCGRASGCRDLAIQLLQFFRLVALEADLDSFISKFTYDIDDVRRDPWLCALAWNCNRADPLCILVIEHKEGAAVGMVLILFASKEAMVNTNLRNSILREFHVFVAPLSVW